MTAQHGIAKKKKQEGPQAVGHSPVNDCSQRYNIQESIALHKVQLWNLIDRATV